MNIQTLLEKKINLAMTAAGINQDQDMVVKQSNRKQFGDYQANGMMAIAKKLNCNPRQLAERLIAHLDRDDMIEKVEVAGAGFINFCLNQNWLIKQGEAALADDKLGLSVTSAPQTVVVDYSAPNVAKEMHVGHLRSTIIGDVAVRILTFLGHRVIKANHIGDWGTQFGMLIAYLERVQNQASQVAQLSDLEKFYQAAKKHYDTDPIFADKARRYVVKLQQGDPHCSRLWRQLVDITMTHNIALYKRLIVSLTLADTMGESSYNAMLSGIVTDLKEKGLAVENGGAVVVYLDEFKNKEGHPMGVIIQKSDGGYLYSTTDLACLLYRYKILRADRILYYTDSRQHQHLQQVWAIARKANYIPASLKLEHHMFGLMLGKDSKPFKTRTGNTVKLNDLLDEAEKRAEQLICQKNPNIDKKLLSEIVDAVAIGSIKYADLSKNRATDYIFDWDKMMAFEGNTAPYLQYAYTRLLSIFRRANVTIDNLEGTIGIVKSEERSLLIRLLQFDEAIQMTANQGLPHILCSYLYDIAVHFSSFYENCPILSAQTTTLRQSRLKLALLTAKTLKIGLDILGIKTVDRM